MWMIAFPLANPTDFIGLYAVELPEKKMLPSTEKSALRIGFVQKKNVNGKVAIAIYVILKTELDILTAEIGIIFTSANDHGGGQISLVGFHKSFVVTSSGGNLNAVAHFGAREVKPNSC